MQPPAIPANESKRLRALKDLRILDTPTEERFDRITRLAARLFNVPVALISLVDSNRQWFKSRRGISVSETPRDVSFCGHAILEEQPFVVSDALTDARFADNPLVTGQTNVRFYAGVPLKTTDGSRVGTLCVIDHEPRRFSQSEEELLRDLGALVQEELNVTRLSEAATLLADREEQLNDLFENASDLIQSVDLEGRFILVNRAWRETLGYTQEELPGLHFLDIVHPDSKGHCAEVFRRVLAGETVSEVDAVFLDRKGQSVYVSGNLNARFENGRPVATRSIFRNVTARKLADEALRETEERMQAVLDNTSDVIFIKDFDGKYLLVNKHFEKLFGRSKKEIIGRTDHEIFSEKFADRFRENDLRVIRSGQAIRIEETAPHDDGVHTYVSTKFLLKNPEGIPYAVCGLAYDITDRKLMEERLRETAALQRAILDSANVTIISTTPEGVIRSFNRAAELKLGYSKEEVVNRTTPELIHDHKEVERRAAELSEELGTEIQPGFDVFVAKARLGPADEQEWTYIRKDGSRFPVLLSVTALRNREGIITGFLGIGIDITERKEVERMKNEFISLVSHELRTPLASVRGALGLVSGGVLGEIPAEAREMIQVATDDTDRLIRLINDILDIEKIEAGLMVFRVEPVDLSALVRQAMEATRPIAMQSGVNLELESEPAVSMVSADPDRIIQVLTNLLSNAIKFSPENSRIRLSITRSDRCFRVSVRDQGPGIPKDFQNRIFQRFAQAESGSRSPGGSGLGLSISRAIVERHRGHIGFESEAGEGATFYFEIPVLPSEALLS